MQSEKNQTFGGRRGDGGTSESDRADSDGEGRHCNSRRGRTTSSDNNNEEHLKINFELMEGSSSSTESDDVAAAGQCDVIARSSSSEENLVSVTQESGMFEWIRGGEEAGTMLRTDNVNSIAAVTPSEEERRQRREGTPRSVTG